MKHPRFFILHLSETSWFQYTSSGDFVVSQGKYKINSRGLIRMHRPICDKNFDLFPYLRKLPTVKKKLYILWIMIFKQQQKMNCGTRLSRISLFVSGEILTINDILRWPGSITVLSIDKGVHVSWLVSFHISLGMIVNGSFCDTPTQEQMYDDGDYWEVRWPMNAVNGIEVGHRKEARPRPFSKIHVHELQVQFLRVLCACSKFVSR